MKTSATTGLQSLFLICSLSVLSLPGFGQISFNNEDGNVRADSRKIRREAARYKADDVKESHLDMDNFSFKKGEPGGKREQDDALADDEIYNAPNPLPKERKLFRRKK